ncbi:hypothetical protein SUGI_0222100 [Cryptomeria japonica]|nr:hypothetical protein SUGI_0222100 [Cryptomeria japonica]
MIYRVKLIACNSEFSLINVYALTKIEGKVRVWRELSERIRIIGKDWIVVVGDFNAIFDLNEKNGGLRKTNRIMEDFRSFVAENEVIEVVPKNGQYAWMKRRLNFTNILERLYQFLVGQKSMEGQFSLVTNILSISISDHFPIQLELEV